MKNTSPDGIRHIDLRADPVAPGRARVFVRATLSEWGYESVESDVCVAVSELITNAVVHAQSATSLTLVDLRGGVRVTVRDEDPVAPVLNQAGETDTGGRGMFLVDALSDNWGVEPDPPGKVVWLDIADR